MNDLIKDLMAQACFETEFDDNQNMPEMMEKFAELIVRECADIAYEFDEPKLSGPGMIIGNRIEEHFGVEE